MSQPVVTYSEDQAAAHDRVAELLRSAGVDLDRVALQPMGEGRSQIMAVIGKAGSGKTLLLAELYRLFEFQCHAPLTT
ncbi:hypothetical protein LCGC14_2596520 [marine sediment metagenome]|uniref:Uncharacterized protein n=1 Tax=marine sediment metagenome TaxID=412755 RepID=A0A0F9AA10_9ZZZZ